MIVWRITGEAATDSSGGSMELLAITPDAAMLPDPHRALRTAAPRYDWYRIDSIERVLELPDAWDLDDFGADPIVDSITNRVSEASIEARQAGRALSHFVTFRGRN